MNFPLPTPGCPEADSVPHQELLHGSLERLRFHHRVGQFRGHRHDGVEPHRRGLQHLLLPSFPCHASCQVDQQKHELESIKYINRQHV